MSRGWRSSPVFNCHLRLKVESGDDAELFDRTTAGGRSSFVDPRSNPGTKGKRVRERKENLKMFFFHFSARIRRESLSLARLRSAEERASKTETGKTVPPPVSSPSLHVTRSWPGS